MSERARKLLHDAMDLPVSVPAGERCRVVESPTWIVVHEPPLLDRAEHRSVRREPTPLLRQATCPLVVSVEDRL